MVPVRRSPCGACVAEALGTTATREARCRRRRRRPEARSGCSRVETRRASRTLRRPLSLLEGVAHVDAAVGLRREAQPLPPRAHQDLLERVGLASRGGQGQALGGSA